MIGVNDLERKWREEAHEAVPEEYTCRGLGEKYLRGDNSAAGLNDAADYLEDAAREAWHPVSEPPTKADGDAFGLIVIRFPACDGDPPGTFMWPWRRLAEEANPLDANDQKIEWARVRDVILLPPQSTTGEGE